MAAARSGADLQPFLCGMQWMRSAIPEFSKIIAPLSSFLEKVYGLARKHTRLAVSKVQLNALSWGKSEEDAYKVCKKALENQVTLAHIDYHKRLCVFTDASDLFWAGVVTQVPVSDITLPIVDQRHEPLAFLFGHFSNSELRWSTLDKESFAIMATIERMHWLLATSHGFDLHTDHNNLIFFFDPSAVVADLSQTTLWKVLRWAVRLSAYSYTCVHFPGTENVWADIMSRWNSPGLVRRLVKIPVLSSSAPEDFCWPSKHELFANEENWSSDRPKKLVLHEDGLYRYNNGAVWIPDTLTDLQLRLCIIAHSGSSGHRPEQATRKAPSESFRWSAIVPDVKSFVQSCMHCLPTTGGGRVPRLFVPAVHGTGTNDLSQFDYIEIAPAATSDKYILMLRDDRSSYCWLFAFPIP